MDSAANRLPKWTADDSYFSGRGLSLLPSPIWIQHLAQRVVTFRVSARRAEKGEQPCDRKQSLRHITSFLDASLCAPLEQKRFGSSILAMNAWARPLTGSSRSSGREVEFLRPRMPTRHPPTSRASSILHLSLIRETPVWKSRAHRFSRPGPCLQGAQFRKLDCVLNP
jgi:hypothetical protein